MNEELSIESIKEMEAGRELDALCHELLTEECGHYFGDIRDNPDAFIVIPSLGKRVAREFYCTDCKRFIDDELHEAPNARPSYSTDLVAYHELWDWLIDNWGDYVRFIRLGNTGDDSSNWAATLWTAKSVYEYRYIKAPTRQLAVARAFAAVRSAKTLEGLCNLLTESFMWMFGEGR